MFSIHHMRTIIICDVLIFQDLTVLWPAKSSRVVHHHAMLPALIHPPCALKYASQAAAVPVAVLLTKGGIDVFHWKTVLVSESQFCNLLTINILPSF